MSASVIRVRSNTPIRSSGERPCSEPKIDEGLGEIFFCEEHVAAPEEADDRLREAGGCVRAQELDDLTDDGVGWPVLEGADGQSLAVGLSARDLLGQEGGRSRLSECCDRAIAGHEDGCSGLLLSVLAGGLLGAAGDGHDRRERPPRLAVVAARTGAAARRRRACGGGRAGRRRRSTGARGAPPRRSAPGAGARSEDSPGSR